MIQILRFPPLNPSTLTLITRWILILADRSVDLIRADGVSLPIARAKSPNLPAMEGGSPAFDYPYTPANASCQALPRMA